MQRIQLEPGQVLLMLQGSNPTESEVEVASEAVVAAKRHALSTKTVVVMAGAGGSHYADVVVTSVDGEFKVMKNRKGPTDSLSSQPT